MTYKTGTWGLQAKERSKRRAFPIKNGLQEGQEDIGEHRSHKRVCGEDGES
uniref:Uncharacterized protein n=1 Tax=viral metagenome TaxID=1070528 RepID=A0A6H1ZBW1_9ZZZZ